MLRRTSLLLAVATLVLFISLTVICTNASAFSQSDSILTAKEQIARDIASGNIADANAGLDNLIVKFGSNEQAVPVIYDLGEKCRLANQYDTAIRAQQFILDYYPDHNDAILAQRALAETYIWKGNVKAASTAIDGLYEKFAENELLPDCAFRVADTYYHWRNFSDIAKIYYNRVIIEFPETKAAAKSQIALAVMYIEKNQDEQSLAEADKYIEQYSDTEIFAEGLMQIAGKFSRAKKYENALEYYQYLADYSADSNLVDKADFEMQKAQIWMYINDQDDANLTLSIDEFIKNYSENGELSEFLIEITKRLGWEKNYAPALKCYEYISANLQENSLTTEVSLEADRLQVLQIIDGKNDPNILAAIDDFIAKYYINPATPKAVYEFIEYYDWHNHYDSEKKKPITNEFSVFLMDKLINTFPETEQATLARIYLERIEILRYVCADRDEEAVELIDKFIKDFNSYPEAVSKNIFNIGQIYSSQGLREDVENGLTDYARRKFEITIWINKKIVDELPGTSRAHPAIGGIGLHYEQNLKEPEKAVVWLQRAIKEAPPGKDIDSYVFLWTRCINALRRNGVMAKEQVDAAQQNYDELIYRNYPNSMFFARSALNLGERCFADKEYDKAAVYLQAAFDSNNEKNQHIDPYQIASELGDVYEKLKNIKAAVKVYSRALEHGSLPSGFLDKVKQRYETLSSQLENDSPD